MAKTLDRYQAAAVEAEGNAVVSAGAGSGKTTVLAERYLRLVRDKKAKVEEILTLTFTRKAAAEMNARIYAGLKAWAEKDPHVMEQTLRFDRARISTLDSFCTQVLKLSANRFGLPPTFSLDDEKAAALARRGALSFLLENEEDPALGLLVSANGFGRVLDGFADLATSYLHLGAERDFRAMFEGQMAFLEEEIGRLSSRYSGLRGDILSFGGGSGFTESQSAILDEAHRTLSGIGDALPAAPDRLLAASGALKALPLPGGKTANPEVVRFKDVVKGLRNLAEELLPLAGTLASRDMLGRVFDLLGRFQEKVLRERTKSGIICFQDCSELAVRALAEDEELRAYHKGLFRYVMIDEFQDNNLLQKNLLYLLAERLDRSSPGIPAAEDLENGKLFFVGDEKQSIYRFRGADVSVFKGLSGELARGGGTFAELRVNYRSEPGLVDFFNHLFSRIMAGDDRPFEAGFEPLESREPKLGQGPLVSIYHRPYAGTEEEDSLGGDEAEAFFLASKIRSWVEEGSLGIADPSGARPARYGDFALLMRSTSNQNVYERMFRLLDVPYEARSTRSLFLEAPVNDIYAFLQCVVHPDDPVAYAALLRSPFVNLSDEAFAKLLFDRRPPFEASEEALVTLGGGDRAKLEAGAALYRRVKSLARHSSVPELLSFLWFEGGYRHSVLRNPANHPYLDLYDHLREYALMVPGEGLPAFLDRIRENLGKYERIPELVVQRDRRSGVRILTVHEAKGLEFPVVVLANAGNQGRNDSGGSELFHVTRGHGLSIGIGERGGRFNYFHALGKKDEEEERAAELKRLLYVACTRAESRLVVSGCFTKMNRSGGRTFLNLVFSALGLSTDGPAGVPSFPCETGLVPDVSREDLSASYAGRKRRKPEEVAAVYEAPPFERKLRRTRWAVTEIAASSVREGGPGGSPIPSPAVDELLGESQDAEVYFGSLCHRLIENAVSGRKEAEPMKGSCPDPGRYARFLDEASRLAGGFFASTFAAELTARGRLESEVGFVSRYGTGGGPASVRGSIDLVSVREDHVVVVDFKTDRTRDERSHDVQLAFYKRAAEDIYGLPAETWLFYLRSGEAVKRADLPEPVLPGGA